MRRFQSVLPSLSVLLSLTAAPPAQAAAISRVGDPDICRILASMSAMAAVARQSGMSQQEAAREMSAVIGQAMSDGPGDAAERQRTATVLGGEATNLLRLAYSMPIGKNDADRARWVQAGEEYTFDYCMGYR